MLPESSNVRDAVLGKNGLVENMNKGSMLIEMSTILPSATMSIYEHLKSKKIKELNFSKMGIINFSEVKIKTKN